MIAKHPLPGGLAALALLLAVVLAPARAQTPAPQWQQLPAAEQALIAPALKGKPFDPLPAERRRTLAEGARRWLAMTPEQQQAAAAHHRDWKALSKRERQQALDRRERFRQLPPEEQQKLLAAQRRFQALTPAQQQQLRNEFAREQLPPRNPLGGLGDLPLPTSPGGLLPH